MSVRFQHGADALLTAANTVLQDGQSTATISFWVRYNAVSSTANTINIFRKQFGQDFSTIRVLTQSSNIQPSLTGTSGTASSGNIPLTVGAAYHLLLVWTAGAQYFYANGTLVAQTSVAGGLAQNASGRLFQLGHNVSGANDIDFTLDDPTVWVGYAGTAQDALDLRDRTKTPSQVNAANLVFGLTLDGTQGSTPAPGDAGLTNYGTGSGLNVATVAGAPVYDAQLGFAFQTTVRRASVTPSGWFAGFEFQDTTTGLLSNLTAVGTAPTVSVNGGASQALASPVWGSAGTTAQPWLLYKLPQQVGTNDSVTFTAPSSWVTTASGVAGPATNAPLTNLRGGNLLPAFTPGPQAMRAGWNLVDVRRYNAVPYYANACKQAGAMSPVGGSGLTLDGNGYVTGLGGASSASCSVSQADPAPNGWPVHPPGVWTLVWDGDATCSLFCPAGSGFCVQQSSSLTGATNNTVTYNVTRPDATKFDVQVSFRLSSLGTTGYSNVRVYPPGVPTNGTMKWHPALLRMLTGAKNIRFMGSLITNYTTVAGYADWTPSTAFSYALGRPNSKRTLTAVGPYTLAHSSGTVIQVTTATPHNLVAGQTVLFSADCPSTIAQTPTGVTTLANYQVCVQAVVDATNFVVTKFSDTGNPVNGTQTYSGSFTLNDWGGMPLGDVAGLCNAAGADCWFNVPAGMALRSSDLQQTFAFLAANLDAGLKLYVEYSNEVWNSNFPAFEFCYGQAGLDGTLPGTGNTKARQWYAKQANACHITAVSAFTAAGRPSTDVVRVVGTQLGSTSVTQDVLAYAQSQGYPVDLLATAAYYEDADNGGTWQSTYGTLTSTWSVDQLHDLTQMWVRYGNVPTQVAAQVAKVSSFLGTWPGLKLAAYEGGPQCGAAGFTGADVVSRAWARHPRQADALLFVLGVAQNPGGFVEGVAPGSPGYAAWCHFNLGQSSGTVHAANDATWGAYYGWSCLAGKGDGSDGRFNNVGSYEALGGLAAGDGEVSVVGHALDAWLNQADPNGLPPYAASNLVWVQPYPRALTVKLDTRGVAENVPVEWNLSTKLSRLGGAGFKITGTPVIGVSPNDGTLTVGAPLVDPTGTVVQVPVTASGTGNGRYVLTATVTVSDGVYPTPLTLVGFGRLDLRPVS